MENDKAIIKNICGNVEERIRACHSRQIAEMLKERLCSELANQCKSEIIQNFLIHYVDNLIIENFDIPEIQLTAEEKINGSKK
jgi:hypothetical protein